MFNIFARSEKIGATSACGNDFSRKSHLPARVERGPAINTAAPAVFSRA